ncbi:DNA primase [Streptococcus fryi]
MAIDKALISEIKHSTNIVDVIGEVVQLTKAGRHFLGLCPFHNEKTPSFNVLEDKQFYHCFGCGKSGDVFKFLEEYRQIPFLESVSILADRLGMSVQVASPAVSTNMASPHQSLYDINTDAVNFYSAVLMTTKAGEAARQYLYNRGLTDDVIRYFHIGLAPDESDFLHRSMVDKYDEQTRMTSGLFTLTEHNQIYDSFRNRIMFPLTDDKGRYIGFSGRIWAESDSSSHQAKYKNTRSTPIFNKSYELYHLDKAKPVIKKTHEVYLMEGFMDVIAAYRSGIVNVVASMGTSLTLEHVTHLKSLTKKVVLTYDGDSAGQSAIAKSLDILKDVTTEIVRLPNQMDPDDFLKATSEEELARYLTESRVSSTEFWLDYLKPENIDNLQAQITYVEKVAKLIAQVPSITAQNTYINKVAEDLPDFDYFQVEQAVNNERLQSRAQIKQTHVKRSPTLSALPVSKMLSALVRTENQLFHRFLHHPFLLNEFRLRENFVFETEQLQYLYLLLKEQGEISSLDLANMPEQYQQAYYLVLEEHLPEEVADGEIQDLEMKREQLISEQDMRKQSKFIRESSNHGDVDTAVEALEALIAQKRRLE